MLIALTAFAASAQAVEALCGRAALGVMGNFFSEAGFMPHGHCYLWTKELVSLHVLSDGLIVFSYYAIPGILFYFIRKRRDLRFSWMFACFGVFIIACGTTHLMEIWNVWHADYWAAGAVKAVTAMASVPTAILLARLVTPALALPSMSALEQLNDSLAKEVATRADAEETMRRLNAELESRAEELARSNADLEQFAYVASHDLQEPLRAVAGCMQILEKRVDGKLDARDHELMQHAIGGAARMQSLIDDLLAFSRVGTRGGAFEHVSCETALQHALDSLSAAIAESGASITHDPLPELPADVTQLTQLLQNLIGNAIKFRGSEPPRVHVSARREEECWHFSVADNGIGIEPQYFERVFVVFQRLHTRREYPGTGVGLAICKRIVERHGGHMWIESEPGRGSTFHFTLPASPSSST